MGLSPNAGRDRGMFLKSPYIHCAATIMGIVSLLFNPFFAKAYLTSQTLEEFEKHCFNDSSSQSLCFDCSLF